MHGPRYTLNVLHLPKLERLADFIYWCIITYCVIQIALSIFGLLGYGRDDTDSPEHRSGFILRTDYGTGCQYLVTKNGVTPRWNAEGDQVGCRVSDGSREAGETGTGSITK